MIISLLVAMDENRGIGFRNRVPWRLSADLKHFKSLTMGHHMIMGRKTFESIGKLLPGRTTIVLTRQPGYAVRLPEGCLAAHSLNEALAMARERGETEVFVIGGGEIYALALPQADRIYLTRVQAAVQADTFFPAIVEGEWEVVELQHIDPDERNQYTFTIFQLDRKKQPAQLA